MTRAQKIIMDYIDKNFVQGSVQTIIVGNDKVKVIDGCEESMTLTMNIFCDILDADTKAIYAISNLPHDFNNIVNQCPTEWTEVDRK